MDLQTLKEQYRDCQKCGLSESRTQVVFGRGNHNAKILLIGEAPGASEDLHGIPFCGISGKILDEILADVGLTTEDIFITNTILCRPPENRNPGKEELANCSDRLDEVIRLIQPKVIVTIGNFATERIIGQTAIKKIHGKIFTYKKIKVVPVVHPASYLYSGRNPALLQQMKDDFKIVAGLINQKRWDIY